MTKGAKGFHREGNEGGPMLTGQALIMSNLAGLANVRGRKRDMGAASNGRGGWVADGDVEEHGAVRQGDQNVGTTTVLLRQERGLQEGGGSSAAGPGGNHLNDKIMTIVNGCALQAVA